MHRLWTCLSLVVLLSACGGGTLPARSQTSGAALTGTAELLELETPDTRREMFHDLARLSALQAGRTANSPVVFPIVQNGEVVAAPALDPHVDLLQAPDAGGALDLVLDDRPERWSDERRDGLQGLSEREAAELVARTLLTLWNVRPTGPVQVDRAAQAPYAAAYVDGILKVNPSLLYLAASPDRASQPAGIQ